MAWLFERMIELAAWVAFIIGIAFLVGAIVFFVQGASLWWNESASEASDALLQACLSASWFVLSALGVGALACIDRYVFDVPEPPASK